MFDPTVEPPIPLAKVPTIPWLPQLRPGRRLSCSTIFRWASKGLNGHRLETLRIGGTACTSEAAIKRFFGRLTATTSTAPETCPTAAKAEALLEAAGIR